MCTSKIHRIISLNILCSVQNIKERGLRSKTRYSRSPDPTKQTANLRSSRQTHIYWPLKICWWRPTFKGYLEHCFVRLLLIWYLCSFFFFFKVSCLSKLHARCIPVEPNRIPDGYGMSAKPCWRCLCHREVRNKILVLVFNALWKKMIIYIKNKEHTSVIYTSVTINDSIF